ncbi:MAG: Crp/Fnr family transcriptional regulator [Niastella sp.]|nr:Crp/Fnr family transcriptional regulator [Niastella sp.]
MLEVLRQYLLKQITLSDEELASIEEATTVKKLRKNQYLLQEGDVWRYNAFVAQGVVRTYTIDDKGNEHIISFAMENWWTGDRESLLTGKPSKYNIDAVEDAVILLIPKEKFTGLTKNIQPFNELVTAVVERSFAASQQRINVNISGDAVEKYQYFLNRYPQLALRVPQHMIASYLGITPETLSRIRKSNAKK